MIQSVDRLSLASEINKCCGALGKIMPILIEVNIGREESKSGVYPEHLEEFIGQISAFNNLSVEAFLKFLSIKERAFDKLSDVTFLPLA